MGPKSNTAPATLHTLYNNRYAHDSTMSHIIQGYFTKSGGITIDIVVRESTLEDMWPATCFLLSTSIGLKNIKCFKHVTPTAGNVNFRLKFVPYICYSSLYNDWRSFVRKLHSLPCIREISWEKCTVGQFWLLPAMCHTPSDIFMNS